MVNYIGLYLHFIILAGKMAWYIVHLCFVVPFFKNIYLFDYLIYLFTKYIEIVCEYMVKDTDKHDEYI